MHVHIAVKTQETQSAVLRAGSFEKRAYPRLLLSLPLQIQGIGEQGKQISERCECIDISRGGVCYKGLRELPLGMEMMVTFDLSLDNIEEFKTLRTRGRVVRVEGNSEKEKEIALQFVEELHFLAHKSQCKIW